MFSWFGAFSWFRADNWLGHSSKEQWYRAFSLDRAVDLAGREVGSSRGAVDQAEPENRLKGCVVFVLDIVVRQRLLTRGGPEGLGDVRWSTPKGCCAGTEGMVVIGGASVSGCR